MFNSAITSVRRSSRKIFRTARRFVVGARGLGSPTVVQWAAHQLRSGPAKNDVENSSFTWVDAAITSTTIVWLHNYWSNTYGIERPSFDVTMVDSAGASVATWPLVLEPDATEAIDVRSECIRRNIPLPFEGQMILVLCHHKLVSGRPVQVFAEYVRDDGEASGVHGQYGFMHNPTGQVLSAMRLVCDEDRRTAIVVTNPYVGPGGKGPLRADVTAISGDGRSIQARLPDLHPRATAIVYLDDLFPQLQQFLNKQPGHLKLKMPCPSSRVATFVEHTPTGRRMVNHGTIDRVFDQGGGIPSGAVGATPLASCLVVCGNDRDTILALPNVWGPIADDYIAVIHLFAPNGSPLATYELEIRQNSFAEVSTKEMLSRSGQTPPPYCHAEIALRPTRPIDEVPAQFDLLVALRDRGELVGEVQVGSDFFNAPIPSGASWPDIRRTRIFCRVRTGHTSRSMLFLAHPVASPSHDIVARPTLTLLSPDGKGQETVTVKLPPHGCLLTDITTLFPAATSLCGDAEFGVVHVRDTEARLYGFHFLETPGAQSVVIDHLVGG